MGVRDFALAEGLHRAGRRFDPRQSNGTDGESCACENLPFMIAEAVSEWSGHVEHESGNVSACSDTTSATHMCCDVRGSLQRFGEFV